MVLQHQVGYDRVLERIPLDRGVLARTIRTGQATLIEDVHREPEFLGAIEGLVSEICVPLFDDQGQAFGALNVESSGGIVLTRADLALMEALSTHISTAVIRGRLYERLQRRVLEFDALLKTMGEISQHLDLDLLLHTMLERGAQLIGCISGELGLYDVTTHTLRIRACYNLDRDYTGEHIRTGEGVMGQVMLTRHPVIVQHYQVWERRLAAYQQSSDQAILAVPMLAGETLIGVMGIGDRDPNRVFTDDDVRLLTLFAQQATIALQNANLFAEIRHLAITDSLTELATRRHFFMLAQHAFEITLRYAQPLSALMLDIDNFKRVNDQYGHAAGDDVLRTVGAQCRNILRGVDIIGRYGGEEIAVVLPNTQGTQALAVAERLRHTISLLTIVSGVATIQVTVSIGVAAFIPPSDTTSLDTLLNQADQAMYRAKQLGNNRVVSAHQQ